MDNNRDQQLLESFQNNPEKAFQDVFRTYYKMMCSQVYKVLQNPTEVEDVVQEIFHELWRKKHQLKITSSLPAYLRRMARTRTLNFIRDKKMKWKETEDVLLNAPSQNVEIEEQLAYQDFEEMVQGTIHDLPPKCKVVFGLSRYEALSNREIAEKLDISVKTVENQITRALKRIKSAISQYRKNEKS